MMYINTQLVRVTKCIIAALLLGVLPTAQSLWSEWKSHAKIVVYRSPHDVQPAAYTVPEGTANATWVFQALGQRGSCSERQVEVHFQHGSLPPIAFRNESFPEMFFLDRTEYTVLKFPADNSSHTHTLLLPRPGKYYTFTFVTKIEDDERLLPGGLNLHCTFKSWMFQRTEPGTYTEIPINRKSSLSVPTVAVTIWFRLPRSTVNYRVELLHCNGSCSLQVAGPLEYGRPNSSQSLSCSAASLSPCTVAVQAPDVQFPHYFRLISLGSASLVQILVTSTECTSAWTNGTWVGHRTGTTADCLAMPLLDRWQAPDHFHAHFLHLPEVLNVPSNITMTVAPGPPVSQGFHSHSRKDIGTTLTVALNAWQPDVTKDSQHIKLCGGLLKGKVTGSSTELCNNASHLLSANSSAHLSSPSEAIAKLHVPFPEAGLWYLTLQLSCYSLDDNGDERAENCSSASYNVSMAVEVNPCLEGHCSAKGECVKLTAGTDLLYYSICDCTAGWRGYACTDGSEAYSHWEQLADALLLTLSNLLFLPVIIVAVRRGFYTEAGAYAFNMFFSTFYHACDRSGRSPIYNLCIMDFSVMQFADFLASTVSVWLTFMAATRISHTTRSLLQVVGILCFSMVYSVDRFNFWNNLGAGLVGGAILVVSWGFTCHQRRSCYPSKRRYVFAFLPGALLSVIAIFVFMFAETNSNYKYTHSFWHAAICISVLFFLPRKPLNGKGAFPVDRVCALVELRCPEYRRFTKCWHKSTVSLEMSYIATEDALNHTGNLRLNSSPVLLRRNFSKEEH